MTSAPWPPQPEPMLKELPLQQSLVLSALLSEYVDEYMEAEASTHMSYHSSKAKWEVVHDVRARMEAFIVRYAEQVRG